jgi:rRNA maturation protein Nop10
VWGRNPVGRDCGGPYSFANRCARTGSIARSHTPARFHHCSDSRRFARAGLGNRTGSLAGFGADDRADPNAYS